MFPKPDPELRAQVLKNSAEGREANVTRIARHIEGVWYLEYFRHLGGSDENNETCRVNFEAKTREEAEQKGREKWEVIKGNNPRLIGAPTAYRPTLCFEQYLESPEHPTEPTYKG